MTQTDRATTDLLLSDIAEIHTTNRLPSWPEEELTRTHGSSAQEVVSVFCPSFAKMSAPTASGPSWPAEDEVKI